MMNAIKDDFMSFFITLKTIKPILSTYPAAFIVEIAQTLMFTLQCHKKFIVNVKDQVTVIIINVPSV